MAQERESLAAATAHAQELRTQLLDTEAAAIQEQYYSLKSLRYSAAGLGLAVAVIGGLGLVGNLTSNWILTSFHEGYKIMVPAVGLALALCGAVVLCFAIPRRAPERVVSVLSFLVLILAGARLAELALGVDYNSSNLFLPSPWMPISPDETPAALPTVVALLAVVLGIFLMRRRARPVLMFTLASLPTIVGAAFLLGYVYGNPMLYGTRLIPIAVPAALALTLLGIAMVILLAAREMALRTLMTMRRAEAQAERDHLIAAQQREGTLLHLINEAPDAQALVKQAAILLREWFDCDAVGIRWQKGGDYPYIESIGFPQDFLLKENELCRHDAAGAVVRDASGLPALECMCGNILRGRTNPALPFFTPGGSFWANSTTRLLATTTDADRQARTRNRCNGEGYESVALIPLRFGETTYGLLQLNGKRPDRFTLQGIEFLERMASSLAVRLAQHESLIEGERLAAEAQRRAAELDTIIESMAEGLLIYDAEGRLLRTNAAMRAMLTYTDEVSKLPLADRLQLLHPTDAAGQPVQPDQTPAARALRGEIVNGFEMTIYTGTDLQAVCLYSGAPLRGPEGDLIGAVVTATDVSAMKRIEEALRSSEQRLSRAQEIAHLGSWELDLVNNQLTWSDEVYRIFGLMPQEFGATYEAFLEHVHPDDRAAVDAAYVGSLRANVDTYEIEHRVIRQDTGEVRTVHEKCEHFRDATGAILRSVGMVQDITSLHEAQQETQRLLRELETVFTALSDPLVIFDTQGHVVRANPAAHASYGLSNGDYGLNSAEEMQVRLPDGRQPAWDEYPSPRALKGETVKDMHLVLTTPDGEEHHVLNSAAPLVVDGKITGAVSIRHDITELRRAQESLAKSEQRYRSVGELVPYGIWTTDSEGAITYVSPALLDLIGISFDEYAGFGWAKLMPDGEREEFVDAWMKATSAREYWSHEYRLRGTDGQYHWLIGRGIPQFDADGNFTGYVGVNIDIGDTKAAQDELQRHRDHLEELVRERTAQLETHQRRLRALAAELVNVEQRERQRISGLLHDDVAQTLGGLKMQLSFLGMQHPEASAAVAPLVAMAGDAIAETRRLWPN